MKFLLYSWLIVLSANLYGGLNTPEREEKDKKGSYIFRTKELPLKYENIWKLSKVSSFYKTLAESYKTPDFNKMNFTWSIFVPQKYKPNSKTGLIVIASNFKVNEFPNRWKQVSEALNYILITPDLSENHKASLELTYASIEFINERYKINQDDINYVCLSKLFEHQLHIHSPDKISGVLNINSRLSTPVRLHSFRKKEQYFSFVSFERPIPVINNSYEFRISSNARKFEKAGIKHFEVNNFKIAANMPGNEVVTFENGKQMIFSKDSYDTIMYETIFKKLPAEELIQLLNFKDNSVFLHRKKLLEEAKRYEDQNKLGEALNIYKILHEKHNTAGAFEKFKNLAKSLNNKLAEAKKLFEAREFSQAYLVAKEIVQNYGEKHGEKVLPIIKECENNRTIQREFKAADYLKKVENAIAKGRTSKAIIVKALKDVISYSPGTRTAEKAEKMLKNFE